MTKFVGSSPWPVIEAELRKPKRPAVIAVLAYAGEASSSMLHLRKGDALVCDASDPTIARGGTNAAALRRIRTRGVRVYSIQGLHAKVIASKSFAWVGSANASQTSTKLIEASVRLSKDHAQEVYAWAHSLCTDDRELTRRDIERKCLIKVRRADRPVLPLAPDSTLPDVLGSLFLIMLERGVPLRVLRAAEREKADARRSLTGQRGALDWFQWDASRPAGLAEGRWILAIVNGEPRPPAVVVRISDHGSFTIVWTRAAKTSSTPSQADLATAMGPAWDRWDDETDITRLVRGSAKVARILDLYRS